MIDELVSKARGAAPMAPSGAHLSDDTLARLRGDDERDEDAEAFRHLSSCAACRARMAEEPADREVLRPQVEAAGGAPRVDAASPTVVPLASRRRATQWIVLAAAAALLVVFGSSLRRPPSPLTVDVRAFAGTMGTASAAVAAADLDLELSFEATDEAAALVLSSSLAPPRPFVREAGRFRLAVAPRTFAPHAGKAIGFVVAGPRESVERATKLASPSEASLRELAGLRVARVEL